VPVSRRSFLQFLGLTGAGAAGAPLVAAPLFGTRGHEALAAALADPAAGAAGAASRAADRALRLHSNENPRGPGAAALDAVRAALGDASRYAGAGPDALRAEVAASHGVPADHVLLGCGSTELLRVAVDAYAGPGRAVVVGAPTFEEPARRAAVVGAPVHAVPVDAALRLDLDAMAARARGAGLLFLNNPNNPTGTLHPAAAVAACVGRVRAEAPGTAVVVDEAYHEYVDDPGYATALPLALAHPDVLVVRTFSKAYGLAGLRVGYAVARPDTIARLAPHRLGLSVNALGAAAARAALADRGVAARERRLNAEARLFTARAFERLGYRVAPSQANFVMVDVRRDARHFQEACRARDVLVGRPFPPLATHARVSIGTLDEMRAAVPVFERVLAEAPPTRTPLPS
jgi:histidinol-phosphate aminotransferase